MTEKRKFSIGFIKPEKLEGDIIYATLEYPGSYPQLETISNESYRYRVEHDFDGISESKKGTAVHFDIHLGNIPRWNSLNELIADLKNLNEIEEDYSRLWEGGEGWKRVEKMMKVGKEGYDW